MDVRTYLEEDILAFLDSRLSVDYLKEESARPRIEEATTLFGKDYERLLLTALQEHNIPKAKRVLHDVKGEFSSHPVGSTERKQLQALLHSLYATFKQYLEEQTKLSKMEHALDEVTSPEEATKTLEAELDGFTFGQALTEESDTAFSDSIQQIENALQAGNTTDARNAYMQAKEQFRNLQPTLQTHYHQQMLILHERIMERIGLHAQPATQETPAEVTVSEHSAIESHTATKRIEKDLIAAMKSENLHEAMIHYEELRAEALQLPLAEQQTFIPRMQRYHEWVLRSWNDWQKSHQSNAHHSPLEKHERRLSGKP